MYLFEDFTSRKKERDELIMMKIAQTANFAPYHPQIAGALQTGTPFGIQAENSPKSQSPMEYYQGLCREFQGVTFRLGDKAAQESSGGSALGYGGSMNQIGEGFGSPGQCSIQVDISVLRKMQQDPEYEKQVKGIIQDAKDTYSVYENQAGRDGYLYTCVEIEDGGARPQRALVNSKMPFSTEEEIRELWENESAQSQIKINFQTVKDSLLEQYLDALEERGRKLQKLGIG